MARFIITSMHISLEKMTILFKKNSYFHASRERRFGDMCESQHVGTLVIVFETFTDSFSVSTSRWGIGGEEENRSGIHPLSGVG
jgi:hypothetical protein